MNFMQMTSLEKDNFLLHAAENPEFAGQTNGQVLYAEIVKSLKKRYAPDKEKNLEENVAEYKKQLNLLIAEVVGKDYAEKYMADLQRLREQRQRDIMKNVEHLYHFSQVPPEQFSQLTTHIQEIGDALQENIGVALCFADTKLETVYPLKPASNNSEILKGVSGYSDEQCCLVSGKDFAEYVESLSPSYRYEVDKSTFKPVVDLDGHFCNEYESKEAANVIRYDGPFNINDVYQKWDIPVFYIPNDEDKSELRNEYSELMKEGMSRREAMTTVCHRHPEKMQLLQEDIGLQKIVDNVLAKKQFGNIVKSEIQTPLTSIEITARKQKSDQRKQKFAAMKAHILNPESGKNTGIEKEKFNPFIKNYLEQRRSK
ncbi:MAG: hypothetical protein IJ852_06435 [Alphaproteobacteria bacterium]|nr:hypothetical protein [Alphaproteobacteria bacterium]